MLLITYTYRDRCDDMNIDELFSSEILNAAITLYENHRVIILNDSNTTVEALVYDEYFYHVLIHFTDDAHPVTFSISKDGISCLCPYSSPYVAAVILQLIDNTQSVSYPHHQSTDTVCNNYFLLPDYVICSKYYTNVLSDIVPYILRIQSANTHNNLISFSHIIDDLFEYIDSCEHDPKHALTTLHIFMHVYLSLSFNFNVNKDIYNSIIDECNLRIEHILKTTEEPIVQTIFRMILINDAEIHPLLKNLNTVETQLN